MNVFSYLNVSLLLLCLLLVVRSQAQVQSNTGKTYDIIQSDLDNKTMHVLHFRMTMNEGLEQLELIDSKESSGHLKELFTSSLGKARQYLSHHDHASKQMKCSLLNDKKSLVYEHVLEYPLVSHYEYPLHESSGEMSHMTVEQEQKDFIIRIPTDKNVNYLKFLTLDTQTKKSISEFEFPIN